MDTLGDHVRDPDWYRPAAGGTVVLDLTDQRTALTYAATVVSELRCRLGEGTAVDGDTRHTLFLLVKWDCHQDEAHQHGPVS